MKKNMENKTFEQEAVLLALMLATIGINYFLSRFTEQQLKEGIKGFITNH